jgi:hypothetical protein
MFKDLHIDEDIVLNSNKQSTFETYLLLVVKTYWNKKYLQDQEYVTYFTNNHLLKHIGKCQIHMTFDSLKVVEGKIEGEAMGAVLC